MGAFQRERRDNFRDHAPRRELQMTLRVHGDVFAAKKARNGHGTENVGKKKNAGIFSCLSGGLRWPKSFPDFVRGNISWSTTWSTTRRSAAANILQCGSEFSSSEARDQTRAWVRKCRRTLSFFTLPRSKKRSLSRTAQVGFLGRTSWRTSCRRGEFAGQELTNTS